MDTQRVGKLTIDRSRLQVELERSAAFEYSHAYSEYLCGGPWRSCVLWSAGGDNGDGLVTNYDFDQPCAPTPYAQQLPYVRELVENNFNLGRLTFGRLAVISNSVIIPHRDLLELSEVPVEARNEHRVHVPLRTTDDAFFSEGDVVYRMHVGDVWFLDASKVHSAASFSEEERVHLILDFSDVDDGTPLVSLASNGNRGIPSDSVYVRAPITDHERDALIGLGSVLNTDNCRDVFSIVIKAHYRRDGGENFVWNTMLAIADACDDDSVREKVHAMRRYFLIERNP